MGRAGPFPNIPAPLVAPGFPAASYIQHPGLVILNPYWYGHVRYAIGTISGICTKVDTRYYRYALLIMNSIRILELEEQGFNNAMRLTKGLAVFTIHAISCCVAMYLFTWASPTYNLWLASRVVRTRARAAGMARRLNNSPGVRLIIVNIDWIRVLSYPPQKKKDGHVSQWSIWLVLGYEKYESATYRMSDCMLYLVTNFHWWLEQTDWSTLSASVTRSTELEPNGGVLQHIFVLRRDGIHSLRVVHGFPLLTRLEIASENISQPSWDSKKRYLLHR